MGQFRSATPHKQVKQVHLAHNSPRTTAQRRPRQFIHPEKQFLPLQQLPETPIPIAITTIAHPMPSIAQTPALPRQAFPPTPTRSILAYDEYRKARRKEPGVSETLMGCGILFVLGILTLLLLYYLALGA